MAIAISRLWKVPAQISFEVCNLHCITKIYRNCVKKFFSTQGVFNLIRRIKLVFKLLSLQVPADKFPKVISQYRIEFGNWHEVKLTYHGRAGNRHSLHSGERLESAGSVEKQRVAGAESQELITARAPFLSGFSHVLRCRKYLG